MIPCPLCGEDNIEGVDVCEQCGQPLSDMHLPDPKNAVEIGLLNDKAGSLETIPPITVVGSTSVQDVLNLLVDQSIGCVFVVNDQKTIIGVFSERDALLRLNTQSGDLLDQPISKYMTENPASINESTRIGFAVHQMDIGGYRHLPILGGDLNTIGVISVRDILGYLTKKLAAGTATSG
ncbi:MAG: CBS domain-containing protein [Planctomycetaceae bacterium]|nr:CBS domain-containing protein [Planctomycetaceae bacterium]